MYLTTSGWLLRVLVLALACAAVGIAKRGHCPLWLLVMSLIAPAYAATEVVRDIRNYGVNAFPLLILLWGWRLPPSWFSAASGPGRAGRPALSSR